MSRVGIVVNPVGDPDAAEELAAELRADHDVHVLETTEDDPGAEMASRFASDGCDVVVACGGDGTVRATAESLVGTDVDLAVLPAGTGNLLALNLDLPGSVPDVAALIAGGRSELIDVGRANGETFLIMAGTGLDTTIMEDTGRELKDRVGPLAYVMTALAHLGDDPIDITLSVDGGEPDRLSIATVLIGNMGRILGPLNIFPDSDWTDGHFDVMAVTADSLAAWVSAAKEALGEPGEHARRFTAKSIGLEFETPTSYQLDGEERPAASSIDIQITQQALSLRRPI